MRYGFLLVPIGLILNEGFGFSRQEIGENQREQLYKERKHAIFNLVEHDQKTV